MAVSKSLLSLTSGCKFSMDVPNGNVPSKRKDRRHCSTSSDSLSATLPQLATPVPSRHTDTPEPASINAIIHEHCHTRLYVPPIAWTLSQLKLLDCQFIAQKPSSKKPESATDEKGIKHHQSTQYQVTLKAAHQLRQLCSQSLKKSAVEEIFATHNIHPLR